MVNILKKLGLSKDINNTTEMLEALDITLQSVDIAYPMRLIQKHKANPSAPLVVETNTKFLCGEDLLLDAMLIFEQTADSQGNFATDPQKMVFTCKVGDEALTDLVASSDVSAAFVSKHQKVISFIETVCSGVDTWNMFNFSSADTHIAILKDDTLKTVQTHLLTLINAEEPSLLAKDVFMQVRDKLGETLILQ